MPKFSIYPGKFLCQECKRDVSVARFYNKSYDLTWMCSEKHLSKVNLYVRDTDE